MIEDEKHFSLNRFQLELEAESLPEILRHYGIQQSKWGAKLREEKRKLEVAQALCTEKIRNCARQYGLKKDTDAIVLKLAMDEPEYIFQWKLVQEAQDQFDLYDSAVKVLTQKGSMIKELVKLWLNNYYSKVEITHNDLKPGTREKLEQLIKNRKMLTHQEDV